MKIIKTEYAGNPKDYIYPKTESETINGNGVERQKKKYIVCIWREPTCDLRFYIYIDFWLYLYKITPMKY